MPEAQKANISIFKYYDNDAMDAMPIEKKRTVGRTVGWWGDIEHMNNTKEHMSIVHLHSHMQHKYIKQTYKLHALINIKAQH